MLRGAEILIQLPFYLLIIGFVMESVVMKVVQRARKQRNFEIVGSGWSAAWKRVLPPPPNEMDPPHLTKVYRIGSKFVLVGLISLGLMFAAVMSVCVFVP